MRNLKVMMAYRGTNYHGFQRQENAVTVQEKVEECLSKIVDTPTVIYGCSRTDTGVHANRYCFSFMTDKNIALNGIVRGMNANLPRDISILSCEEADENFHARYSCKGKEYLYKIHNSESPDPFAEDLAFHYRRPLDIGLITEASRHYIGTHDFKSFCSSGSDKVNTVRTIYDFKIIKEENNVSILVNGDGFLYNMVRIMVGTLLYINEGKLEPMDIKKILDSKDRKTAGRTAQPHGLYLNRVFYDSL